MTQSRGEALLRPYELAVVLMQLWYTRRRATAGHCRLWLDSAGNQYRPTIQIQVKP
ncbi:MAG: hypothetical protein HC802_19140 [Caldilineaceae bacterium]|nr:hypothetical protein [Caldilineaceae bacterium]